MKSKTFPPEHHQSRRFAGVLATTLILSIIIGVASAQKSPEPDAPLVRGRDLCASGQLDAGRAEFARLAADTNAPAALRSIAQLSLGQTWRRVKDWRAAETEYAKVLAMRDAPAHHREEAEAQIRELTRLKAGQPARDPLATRAALPPRPASGAEWHLSPRGSDAQPGTQARPFATLERARDEIRQLKQRGSLPPGGVAVVVHGGRYSVARTFALAAEDSGTAQAPVVYRAAAGETPVFSGGRRLTQFELVRDATILQRLPGESRGQVFQTDLKAHGITNVPPVRVGGFASGAGFRSHPALELFFNGAAMPLSGWPNEGFVKMVDVRGQTPQAWHGPAVVKEGVFTYGGDGPARGE